LGLLIQLVETGGTLQPMPTKRNVIIDGHERIL
jgi:hypothetical protein